MTSTAANAHRQAPGPAPRQPTTAAERQALARIVRLHDRIRRLEAQHDELIAERTRAYLEALDLRLTCRVIAQAIGVTDSAIVQFVRKARAAQR